MTEVQPIADLLIEGVWWAFGAGALFGSFILGPVAVSLWEAHLDRRDAKREAAWLAS